MRNQTCAIYGIAFLGALVYFIQHSTTFWGGVLGFFKAVFWPALVLYKVLELLNYKHGGRFA
ncbi:hypothetical protein ACFS5N_10740 [Mucilaginibacter ximonensis]|uniref:DUF5668 domain-containing protein n=1 Tax=Mucilaginibacter ximonensis TaxID=538021 RepID=A0ABW5YCG7_9SPHI